MSLLTINAGSSSLKVALYDDEAAVRKAAIAVEQIGGPKALLRIGHSNRSTTRNVELHDHAAAINEVFNGLPELLDPTIRAIGHRLVHGGPDHQDPERITPSLLHALKKLEEIDRTHTPQALAIIEAVTRRFPGVPQFACFDTAFHRSMPDVAQRYPLPRWTLDAGVRRYGFHGLSCESIIAQLEKISANASRVLIAHLGNGASVTAVRDAVSVDTTMGFSPTGGLMMGTRCGDLDPTVVTFLMQLRSMRSDAVEKLVNENAGLLAASELSPNMHDLLKVADSNSQAAQAIELYCYIARKHFAALAAVLGGLDTIVFTGGIGENAVAVREKICSGLQHLGVQLDDQRNRAHESVISSESSGVIVRVIRTDEDSVIAKHLLRLLGERRK
jgi:acetate kinase